MSNVKEDEIKQIVRERYGSIAEADAADCGCSTSSCCGPDATTAENISRHLGYSEQDVSEVPEGANMGLGCGNPQAIANLKPGETVLDLGAGGGFDCFLASKAVGSEGKVIGVDMTASMISKARNNSETGDYTNVEFRLGEIENIPAADNEIDVIISNCVINLSPAKDKVYKEAFRVLKPGGRLAVSDIVAIAPMPDELSDNVALYTGCVAGASPVKDQIKMMEEAGFEDIRIKSKSESEDLIDKWGNELVVGAHLSDYVISASIEAVKP